ncbi:MAG: DUF4271 domain-containing protein [Bacteroidota bacterium]
MILLQNIIDSNYHYQPSWVMLIIVLSVMILGYLFSAFHARFIVIIKAFFTIRFSEQLSREEHSLSHPASIFLSINFLVASSLFILQAISSKGVFSSSLDLSFLSFLIIIGFVFVLYLLKILSLKIVGFILNKQVIINEYIFIIFLINQVLGIGFIPIIIFIAYGKQSFINGFVYIGVMLFILAFIIRVGKGTIMVFSGREISVVYLILYLCTLEVFPLLLGWKLIEKLA